MTLYATAFSFIANARFACLKSNFRSTFTMGYLQSEPHFYMANEPLTNLLIFKIKTQKSLSDAGKEKVREGPRQVSLDLEKKANRHRLQVNNNTEHFALKLNE